MMPVWGMVAQLSLSFVAALVAAAVYRVQADKLFLEFRDRRAQALENYRQAAKARLALITSLGTADIVGLVDPDRLNEANAARWDAASELRTWFGAEVEISIVICDAALDHAFECKMNWCAHAEDRASNFNDVSKAILDAHRAIQNIDGEAVSYINAGRRGLTVAQRIRGTWRRLRASRHRRNQ